MSPRFVVNFLVLLLGAGLVVIGFAFSAATLHWFGLGVGVASIVAGLANFAMRDQGGYQRVADLVIVVVGTWAIVAARVMADRARWLELSAGLALAGIGAIGLVVRETSLSRGLRAVEPRLGADQFARISALTPDQEPRS